MSIVAQATGARQNLTIVSVTGTTVTLSAAPTGVTAGDMLILRPATPSFAAVNPFLWSRTEFRLGIDAATAFAATHTPMEDGSMWSIKHPFNNDKGEARSGSFDPASLVRSKSVDATVKLKHFFYNPDEVRNYVGSKKVALVIRCFTGTGYEFRLTLNNLTITKGGDKPLIKTEESEYYDMEYTPAYDITDGQGLSATVINSLAS